MCGAGDCRSPPRRFSLGMTVTPALKDETQSVFIGVKQAISSNRFIFGRILLRG